uniref:Delta-aminolevulinic acid dehydratase n=2 Tax=Lygus hesperus TaxID=30085 RepID=A0A0A9XN56_LYGHE
MQSTCLHSSLHHPVLREWNSPAQQISPAALMLPLFIVEDDNKKEEISSMPGVYRWGVNKLLEYLKPLVERGLRSVLLFGVVTSLPKDDFGTNADSAANPVVKALPSLTKAFPELLIACDVCLCPYTSHGHCGLLNADGTLDNDRSIARLAEIALAYALAGAHIVAPSDMMDGRIGSIKEALRKAKLGSKASVLSYAAKFCSSFYGPFRDAAKSAPSFGDRKCYQLPPGSRGLAKRAVERDIAEGADFIMVKPGLPYLDILYETKTNFPTYPLFVYQVSGEYAMIYHAAKNGAIDLRKAVEESITGFRRAGADCIITYFTPLLLAWLCNDLSFLENGGL